MSRQDTPESNITDTEANSSYCLLSNNDLHFLPYSANNQSLLVPNNSDYPIYSSFLNNKTVSSFDSCNSSLNNVEIGNDENNPIIKLLENYKSHAIYLPDDFIPLDEDNDQNNKIKSLLLNIFAHWNYFENISIKKLTGGITNMLLECTYKNPSSSELEIVLVRTYGNGTDLIIDRDREFVSHLILNSLNLAPPIHARFGNGLVYGYIEGRSLNYDELSDSVLYPLIASKLGCLHRTANVNMIDDSLNKLKRKFHLSNNISNESDNIWSVLLDWIEKLPYIPSMLELCLNNHDILTLSDLKSTNKSNLLKSILINEIQWLKKEIGLSSVSVVSHNDLLSGNVIIPTLEDLSSTKSFENFEYNPLSFIDYEYMMPAPRAFDIANHFMEWQGFDCDKSKIPQFRFNKLTKNYENETIFSWCKYYLNTFHSSNPNLNPYSPTNSKISIDDSLIQHLVNEIAFHYGMPGLYWGVWSCIQSEISFIDFDYASYSCERLIEYWNWKRTFLTNKIN
jgi:ethanolamine kinase